MVWVTVYYTDGIYYLKEVEKDSHDSFYINSVVWNKYLAHQDECILWNEIIRALENQARYNKMGYRE